MLKGIFALRGAGKVRRIARTLFWLALISAASQHELLVGFVLYPVAVIALLVVDLSPVLLLVGCLLAWYWHRHHRLPGWISRRIPVWLRRRVQRGWPRGWLMDVFPGHRRRVRRRWPRRPASWEMPTDEFPVLVAPVRPPPADVASVREVAPDPPASTTPLP